MQFLPSNYYLNNILLAGFSSSDAFILPPGNYQLSWLLRSYGVKDVTFRGGGKVADSGYGDVVYRAQGDGGCGGD
jgi:hypothetical protein